MKSLARLFGFLRIAEMLSVEKQIELIKISEPEKYMVSDCNLKH
jgi:hypothetical protein